MNVAPATLSAMIALLAVVLVVATRPWWRAGAIALRRREANVAAYRSRLAEIETERASGLITAEDSSALQNELAARLLADADGSEPETEARSRPARIRRARPIALMAVLLAAFAAGGYALSGSWRVQRQIAEASGAQLQVDSMVRELAAKMQREPNNAEGWALLGRSYFVEQHYDEAAKAYAQANTHAGQPDAEWLTDEGEALAFSRERDLLGRPAQLFEQALQLRPDYGKALWYAGLAAQQQNDAPKALALWTRLSKQDLPPEMHQILDARLADLQPGGAAKPTNPANSVVAESAPRDGSGAANGPVLHLKVTLDPKLASKLPADAALFVFAKAEQGPPMPLAVQRFPKAVLPSDVTLDDSQGMTPAMKLSQFDRYIVTARVSQGGGALPVSGDLQGSLHVARSEADKPLQLVIDSIVP